MAEFNPNYWQGRRKDQVETNETLGVLSFIALVIILTAAFAVKILAL